MLVLALDSTTRAGSIALLRDGALIDQVVGDAARPHAERLPGDATQLLARHGFAIADVGLFAVAAGPGSFTGLRIGIAAVQGLAWASGRPVVGVSALEALAHTAWRAGLVAGGGRVGVWMDAQRSEVFSAVYAVPPVSTTTGERGLSEIDAAAVEPPGTGASRWHAAYIADPFPIVGDGAIRYAEVLRTSLGDVVRILEPQPIAPSIAALAAARYLAGDTGLPHALRPVYVRRPDAELARDKRAQTAP